MWIKGIYCLVLNSQYYKASEKAEWMTGQMHDNVQDTSLTHGKKYFDEQVAWLDDALAKVSLADRPS